MTNDNVDFDDVKATAAAKAQEARDAAAEKAEQAKEVATEKFDEVTTKLDGLSTNKKLLLTAGVTFVVSVVVSKVVQRFRAIRVDESVHVDNVTVVLPEDVA